MGHDENHKDKHDYNADDALDLGTGGIAEYGVAELDSGGKIPLSDLPDSIVGAMQYQGTWDASGGTYPNTFDTGYYWVVSVAGTISGTDYEIGDWIVNNGDETTPDWQKIDNSDKVSSVDSRTGAVTLNDLYASISHATKHTDGTDDIQDATAAQKGLATAAQITKLDGVEAGADVTGDHEADISLANLGEKDHISLTNVTSDQHHAKSHAHDGADGSGTVTHTDTTGQTTDDHHTALEVYDQADTKQTSSKKLVQHSFSYTNGGNTINLPSFTNASVKPKITFGIELNGLSYDSRTQITPLITSLTHDGSKWVLVVRCNKTYFATPPGQITFAECATNDVDITIIAGGE